ncbi:MAG: cyclase family protein [Bacteroidia bacterium]|nr:cyclase family protein [Bacteroidia bacterium]
MKDRIIDLSYKLTTNMVVYPGNKRPVYEWLGRDNSEGYNLTFLSMVAHTGTHADSPLHFIEGGQTIDLVDLNCFYGKTRLFSFEKEPNSQEIMIEDIMDDEDEVEQGSIFVLRTGIEKLGETKNYNYKYPIPSKELIQLLIRKKVRSYMTDATSLDPYGSPNSENHLAILGNGIPIIENLRNLELLKGVNSFTICALPLPLEGREGSPCRAIAILSD